MKKVLFGLVLFTISFSLGLFVQAKQNNVCHRSNTKINKQDTSSIQTQTEMNDQAFQAYAKTDKELNDVYKKILKKYKDDNVFLKKLKLAELAWIKYRDAEIEAIYPEPYKDNMMNYGCVYPMCKYVHLTEITEQRIKELKLWLKGIQEGDVCAGSRRWE